MSHPIGFHSNGNTNTGRSVKEMLAVLRAVRAANLSTKMYACLQRPGDLIYVPSLWWHMTLNIGEAAGFSFQRYHLSTQEVYDNMGSGTSHMYGGRRRLCTMPVYSEYLTSYAHALAPGVWRSSMKWRTSSTMQCVLMSSIICVACLPHNLFLFAGGGITESHRSRTVQLAICVNSVACLTSPKQGWVVAISVLRAPEPSLTHRCCCRPLKRRSVWPKLSLAFYKCSNVGS